MIMIPIIAILPASLFACIIGMYFGRKYLADRFFSYHGGDWFCGNDIAARVTEGHEFKSILQSIRRCDKNVKEVRFYY